MDRHMRKALLSRVGYDWETHQETRHRNARQLTSMPAPEYPATGTARISALLTQARNLRDEALRHGVGDGAGGLRTGTPMDNIIGPAAPSASDREPVETPLPITASNDLISSMNHS